MAEKKVKKTVNIPEKIERRLYALKARGYDINMTKLLVAGALRELDRLEREGITR